MNRILDQLALLLMLALLGLAIQHWEKSLAIISAGMLVVIVYLIIPRANRPEAERQIEKEEKKFEREPALGKLTVSKNSKPSEFKREFLLQPKSIRRQRGKAADPWYDGPAKAVRDSPNVPDYPVAWHSSRSGVYHNNTLCDGGNRIRPERLEPGTGGRRLCEQCARLNYRNL